MAHERSLQLELGADRSHSDEDVSTAEAAAGIRSSRSKALLASLGFVALLASGAAFQRKVALHKSLASRVKDFAGATMLDDDNWLPGTMCPNGCCPHTNWYCCPDAISCAVDAQSCTLGGPHKESNLIPLDTPDDQCMYDPTAAKAPSCFPGEATVQIYGSTFPRAMDDLKEGDKVLVGSSTYEPVIGFLHTLRGSSSNSYLAIAHERGVFRASANHLVFTSGSDKRVADLEAGDLLIVNGELSRVLSVYEETTTAGMYAPLTASGRIVVDGVLASTYAGMASGPKMPHAMMHTLFFPARAYHALGLSRLFSVAYFSDDRGDQMSALVALYFHHLQLHKVQSMMT
eukprot:TRINITY_DN12176_c0_g1_i1.p1 TRINITY_DN12176_c0_g1~~TRINITY_DN12176_c0_g1_i1.p1  ORF type:complete len:345 (+),score=45.19 TRINITY_DN12176_c0_g1_i1:91-1125(+)